MATALPLPSRPLTAIVCDLTTVKARIACLDARLDELTDENDREWDALTAREYALSCEFDAAVYAATGVSWDLLERTRA